MKTKLFAAIAGLSLGLPVFASQITMTGVLTDIMCTKKHMMPGKRNADCVRECVKEGAKYVVVSSGKVVELFGKEQQLSDLAGKRVKVSGEMKGKTLVVAQVEAAQ
jgi:hypothetical protein